MSELRVILGRLAVYAAIGVAVAACWAVMALIVWALVKAGV